MRQWQAWRRTVLVMCGWLLLVAAGGTPVWAQQIPGQEEPKKQAYLLPYMITFGLIIAGLSAVARPSNRREEFIPD